MRIALCIFLYVMSQTIASAAIKRELASYKFPQLVRTNSVDDILEEYPAYLKFVVEIGKSTDFPSTQKMVSVYETLKRYYPSAAADFLKGLRFELHQRLELSGRAASGATTSSPELRSLVKRYVKLWLNEADEHLFRARVSAMVAKKQAAE